MEKIIHFTVPKTITSIQTETIERAGALHPTWEIKVWQDPVHSDGYLLERYWSKVNSGAQLSDLIRLDVIYKWGGVYVDGDLRLLKPLDTMVEKYDVFFAAAAARHNKSPRVTFQTSLYYGCKKQAIQ